jgi:hypothetical protein
LTRNQIAEEEVNRIGRFNAEILGHNNPAQRIMYVDRIRRELADAKQVSLELEGGNLSTLSSYIDNCDADTRTREYRRS